MLLLFVYLDCFGYIYYVSILKKKSNEQDKEVVVIGLGDYHDKDHPANESQRVYLETFLQRCNPSKIKLIVEDLSSFNNNGKGICCNYVITPRGGILGKLADQARRYGVNVDNVEYRFCRVVGIGPLLNNRKMNPQTFPAAKTLTMNSLYKEVLDEMEHITQFKDGDKANALYQRFLAQVKKSFNRLKLDKVKDVMIADYCARFLHNNYVKQLEHLCIFDSPLIDAKILHAIVSSDDCNLIIVVAGGSHIEKMVSSLETIGYTKAKLPINAVNGHQLLENSLNQDKVNNRGYRPPAIDLKMLDEWVR